MIQEIIDQGILAIVIEFIQQNDHPHLLLEATWIVANMAYGDKIHISSMI